jgi:hypothetical protein
VQTKTFKISYNIISKVLRNEMLEELRLGSTTHLGTGHNGKGAVGEKRGGLQLFLPELGAASN